MFTRRWGTAAVGSLVPLALLTAPAVASVPPPDGGGLSALRQATVDRANAALTHGRTYQTSSTSPKYTSVPNTANHYNYLGRNGSNANRNQYTGFVSEEWCGDFAAAIWTGHNKPNPASFPRIPDSYPSSQAWATDGGSAFHPFAGHHALLPTAGDVLVWTNNDASTGGHVGVVVRVNYDTKKVTTVEGNAAAGGNHDSIARFTYAWDSDGPSKSGKWFRGFRSRS